MKYFKYLATVAIILMASGCTSQKPMPAVDFVDLQRFMGDWYVIANIPTFVEKNAFNPVESYQLNNDGTVATTFTFNSGSADGELRQYHPKGFIKDTSSNAIWSMQFIWPFKADYRVVYLDESYQKTIIGRNRRDYVWIMARTPKIPESDYTKFVSKVESLGYDINSLNFDVQGK